MPVTGKAVLTAELRPGRPGVLRALRRMASTTAGLQQWPISSWILHLPRHDAAQPARLRPVSIWSPFTKTTHARPDRRDRPSEDYEPHTQRHSHLELPPPARLRRGAAACRRTFDILGTFPGSQRATSLSGTSTTTASRSAGTRLHFREEAVRSRFGGSARGADLPDLTSVARFDATRRVSY